MLRLIFVIVILTVGFVSGLFSRFGALLAYLWFALFRPQEFLWADISSYRVSLILGAFLVIPSVLTGIFPNVTHPLSIGAILLLVASGMSHLDAVNPEISWYWLDYLARLFLICLLTTRLVDTPRRFVIALAVIAGSLGFYSAKAGVFFFLAGGTRYMEGTAGAFADNNGWAMGTAMIVPLLFASGQLMDRTSARGQAMRLGFFAAVPLSVLAVVGTYSRGGALALLAGGCAALWLHRQRIRGLLVTGLSVVVLGLVITIPKDYGERLGTVTTYAEIEDFSSLGRLHFWRVATVMARARPLGVGLKNFESAYDQYDYLNGAFGRRRSVHSSHYEVLAEVGWPGLIIWVGQFILAFVIGFRNRRRGNDPRLALDQRHFLLVSSNALMASMVAFLVGGSFVAASRNDLTWLTFALLASLDLIGRRMLAERKQEVGTLPRSGVTETGGGSLV